MKAANRVIINTGILYTRMLITMGISLFATRVTLNALGATDYGIFNLIAGVITMLSFLNTAMATSTQRYLSFHQGKGDIAMQKKVFEHSLLLHILLAVLIVTSLETAGAFLLDDFLNVPAGRLDAAKTVYHYMSATVFFTIISVPFLGSLTAHENMVWVAIVSIVETLLKLAIALLLLVIHQDKLVVYGLLSASISILTFSLYLFYCLRSYPECKALRLRTIDKSLLRELASFAGWNTFGSLCSVGRAQGIAVLLNIFFGTVINAAYGIASQVSAQLIFFSATMLRATNPQIMKSEGANDRPRMLRLAMTASKFGFFLLAIFAIPIMFEMPAILKLWLKNVPQNTVIFCQLILLGSLANQLTIGLQSALQATGKIKWYQIVVGTTLLLNLPIAYVLLKSGFPPYAVLISYAFIELIACSLRITFSQRLAGLSPLDYFKRVFAREVIPVTVSVLSCLLITQMVESQYRFLLTTILSMITFVISIYYFGLCSDEKALIGGIFAKVQGKIFKKQEALAGEPL